MTIINSTAVSATFTAPTYNGNAPIANYVLLANGVIVGSSNGSPIIGTGLTSTNTAFTVAAVNVVGLGKQSDIVYATPSNVPVNLSLPTISGTASVGQTLTTTNGTWSHDISSYAYQWQRAGANISSATSSSYTLVSADLNNVIRCLVTATSATTSNFTTANTANTSSVSNIPPPTVEYLVVAGGGAGGNVQGGGGGAGGYRTSTGYAVQAGNTISVTVGGGGANGVSPSNGTSSVFGNITSVGGGFGGYYMDIAPASGGSGGGAGRKTNTIYSGGSGTAGQGNAGGGNAPEPGGAEPGGGQGGGGAGSSGGRASVDGSGVGGAGGSGLSSSISGSSVTYAAGGGGYGDYSRGSGGSGIGGDGATQTLSATGASGIGSGGGGGGARGGAGSGGIVIIRYSDTYGPASSVTGSASYSVSGGYRIYTWTGSGSITF